MNQLFPADLRRDPESREYIKRETVTVVFATEEGELISQEGPNRYLPGDALITGSTGVRWTVSRDRFDPKYEPIPPLEMGQPGHYRNRPIPVLAKQIREPFSVARSEGGDVLRGKAGDWFLQYAPGDFGVVDQERFEAVYRLLAD